MCFVKAKNEWMNNVNQVILEIAEVLVIAVALASRMIEF